MSRSRWRSRRATPWVTRINKNAKNGAAAATLGIEETSPQTPAEFTSVLSEQVNRAQTMLDYVCDAVITTDIKVNITYMNRAAETLTGFSRQDAIGRPIQEIFQVIDMITRQPRKNLARQVIETDCAIGLHNGALMITRKGSELAIEDSATPLHNTKEAVVGALIMFHDARYSSETTARMTYLAQHDALTGLLNRHAFAERFHQAAGLARRHHKKMVLLFIDLDDFKEINDAFGHTRGDALLKALGKKLLECVRATDHVCRHGGDEFVVLLSDLEQPEQAFAVVDKVRDAAADLLQLDGWDTSVTLSIGVSVYPDQGETLDVLLPHADAAMYRVKASNKQSRTGPKDPTQSRPMPRN